MPRIFISYRRADTAGHAGRLYDHLSQYLDPDDIFMDIADIPPGEDFVKVLEDSLAEVDVVLVLIGPHWLTLADNQGRRRLDDPADFVRLEVITALNNPAIRVIPVLVNGAHMPSGADLPEDLQPLARRNAVTLDNARFGYDVERLALVLGGKASSAPPVDPQQAARHRYWRWGTYSVLVLFFVTGIVAMLTGFEDAAGGTVLSVVYCVLVPAVFMGMSAIWPLRTSLATVWAVGVQGGLGLVMILLAYLSSPGLFESSENPNQVSGSCALVGFSFVITIGLGIVVRRLNDYAKSEAGK